MNWEDILEVNNKYSLDQDICNKSVAVNKEKTIVYYDEKIIIPLRFFNNLAHSLKNVKPELKEEELKKEMYSDQIGCIFNLLKTLSYYCVNNDTKKLDAQIILEFKDALKTNPDANEILGDFVTSEQKEQNIYIINKLFSSKENLQQKDFTKKRTQRS